MKSHRTLKLIILLILLFNKIALCQVRPIFIYSPIQEEVLKKNKIFSIKEIKYFKETGIKESSSEYHADTTGKIIFRKYNAVTGNEILKMLERISTNPADRSTTKELGQFIQHNDSIHLYEKKIQFHTAKNEVYRNIEIRYEGNKIVDDFISDTLVPNKSYRFILTTNHSDTVRIITYSKTKEKDIYTLREKKDGEWNYDERQITLYKDEKFTKYTRTINGKIVSEYGPEKIIAQDKDLLENNNPLPYDKKDKTDSSYVMSNDCEIIPPDILPKTQIKMLKIQYYVPYIKDKPLATELFYTSGLLFIRDNTFEKFLTFYEYGISEK